MLAEYSEDYLRAMLATIAGVIVVAYCIWCFEDRGEDGAAWPTAASAVPFVLGIMRYGLLVDQGHGEEPEALLLGDRTLLGLAIACFGLLALGRGAVSALLTGWGRTAPTRAEVVRPESAEAVAAALANGRPVIARGLGRAYGDAAQNAGGLVVDATGLDEVHAFDAERGVIDAGAGLGLEALIARALPHGWFVPVTPGTRHVTLGGALAADVHGKNHHVDGAFSRHVESFELALPGGELREVGPEDPLFAATAGGMGLDRRDHADAAAPLAGHERLHARDDDARGRPRRADGARCASATPRFRYSVAWIDCLKRGAAMGRGVLLRGEHATAEELPPKLRRKPLAYAPRPVLGVPDVVPSGLLNTAVARAFNEAYFRRAPAQEHIGLEAIGPYFHPLDAVAAWNRLYGPRGFVQYQAVVPDAEGEAVRALLERVSGAGMSSFLAVLKRFGEGTGMLSFPMAGWTLALDIPVGASDLARRLDELDEHRRGRGRARVPRQGRPRAARAAARDVPRPRALARDPALRRPGGTHAIGPGTATRPGGRMRDALGLRAVRRAVRRHLRDRPRHRPRAGRGPRAHGRARRARHRARRRRAARGDRRRRARPRARRTSHAAAVERVFARPEGIDVAIVAAGLLGRQGDEQLADAAELHAVNGAGTVSVLALCAEAMRRQGRGTIVLLSTRGRRPPARAPTSPTAPPRRPRTPSPAGCATRWRARAWTC